MTLFRIFLTLAYCGLVAGFAIPAKGETQPLLVELKVSPTALDPVALCEAIGHELSRPVVTTREAAHSGEMLIQTLPGGQVSVTYLPADNRPSLKRVVVLPEAPERRVLLISWLVGNLARNEAEDWLESHQREKQTELARDAASNIEDSEASALKKDGALQTSDESDKKTEAKTKEDLLARSTTNQDKSNKAQQRRSVAVIRGSVKVSAPATIVHAPLGYQVDNLALWHKWLELYPESENLRFKIHLGLGYGRVGGISGFGFDVLHHRVDVETQGFSGSLGWTRVARTQGLALSFGAVTAEGELQGVDYAGLFTYRKGSAKGAVVAGLASYNEGPLQGAQVAGIYSRTDGDFQGAQVAGVFAMQTGRLQGFQWAGVANLANDVDGLQLGPVNVAGNVRGLQIGLVNVARRVDGMSLGLVNIAENIRTQALAWVERDYLENVGVRYLYSPMLVQISSGYNSVDDRARFLFGLGARFASKTWAISPSLNFGFVIDKVKSGPITQGHEKDLRVALEWEPVPNVLGIMTGPTLAFWSDGTNPPHWRPRWFAGLTLF